MAKLHILNSRGSYIPLIFVSYCGRSTTNPDLFMRRPQKGDICKSCIRTRIAHKRIVRKTVRA